MAVLIERLEIDANGMTFSARAAGQGKPVLLLHGFPQSSWTWRDLLVRLAEGGYRGVAPDLRGYSIGARPAQVAAYRIPELVSDVLSIADTMEMEKFDLVGHDWGGMLAWVIAAMHPDRVRRLVVVSTPHPGALRAALISDEPAVETITRVREQPFGPNGLSAILDGVDPVFAEEYKSLFEDPEALAAAMNWYRAMDSSDVDNLPPVVVPTRYLWSTGDTALSRTAAEATAEWVAGSYHLDVLEGVSHWIPEEAPDELARIVLEHLGASE